MKTIAIAALLAALGSGAALAQGAPPGSPAWKTATALAQAQGVSGAGATVMNPGTRMAGTKRGRAIPVAGGLSVYDRRA
jgi:hypothetical protein